MSAAQGRFAFGIAGAIIGSFFGYPGLGFVVGSFIGSLVFPPEGQDAEGPRLQSLKVSDSKYGVPIPVLYGTYRMGGTYIWATDIIEKVKKEKAEGGGKGGGSSSTIKTYTYFGNFAILFCDSPTAYPVVAITKIFADNKVLADYGNLTGPIESNLGFISEAAQSLPAGERASGSSNIRRYFGEENQQPDPLMESHVGVGLTPAYRGSAYIMFDNLPLENYGNRIPQVQAVVTTNSNEPYPYVEWDFLQTNNNFVWSPDGVLLFYNISNSPGIIDSHKNTWYRQPGAVSYQPMLGLTSFNGDVYEGPYDMNRFGWCITSDGELSGATSIGLHDVWTGQGLARDDHNDCKIVNALMRCRFAGASQEYIFVAGQGVEDNQFAWYWGAPSANDPEGTTHPNWPTLQVITAGTIDGAGGGVDFSNQFDFGNSTGIRGFVVDVEGRVWMATNHPSNTIRINKMAFGGGVLEYFEFTGYANGTDNLGYDRKSNSIYWVANGSEVHSFLIDDEILNPDYIELGATINEDELDAAFRQGTIDGETIFGLGAFGGPMVRLDIPTMTEVKRYQISNWVGMAANSNPYYDPYLNAVLITPQVTNEPWTWMYLDRINPDGVTLKSILDNLDYRVGYVPDTDTDASPHASTLVPGWIVSGRTQVKSVKQTLSELYQFLVIEEEHEVKHPPRGTASVDNLTSDDLGARQSFKERGNARLEETRVQDADLPKQLEYEYVAEDLDYQEAMTSARRTQEIVNTERLVKRTYPVNITHDDIRQRAQQGLHQAWMDRTKYKFSLFPKKMLLSPGDVITVIHDGQGHIITLLEVEFGANNMVECTGVGFPYPASVVASEVDTVVSNIAGQNTEVGGGLPGDITPAELSQILNPTTVIFLDIPLLDPSLDPFTTGAQGGYIVASPYDYTASWNGATVQRSDTGNVGTFEEYTFYPQTSIGIIGYTTTTLGNLPTRDSPFGKEELYTIMDTSNTVDIAIDPGVMLSSLTLEQLYQDGNVWLIGDEIIQAMTVTDNDAGEWTLSNLIRGRRGTHEDSISSSHSTGEQVAFLSSASVRYTSQSLEELDADFYYRAYTLNGISQNPITRGFTSTGNIIKPPPVSHVEGSKNGSDWNIDFKRKVRGGASLQTNHDLPNRQTEHDYECDILDGNGNVIRTITTTATVNGSVIDISSGINAVSTVIYDQLDQEADFSESPIVSPYPLRFLECNIYQLEETLTGDDRGYEKNCKLISLPDPITSDANFDDVILLIEGNSLTIKDRSKYRKWYNSHFEVGSSVSLRSGTYWDTLSGLTNYENVPGSSDHNSQYGSASLRFAGSGNNYVRLPRTCWPVNIFDFAGDFTIECWARQDNEHRGVIASVYDAGSNRVWVFRFNSNIATPAGALRFIASEDGSSDTVDTGNINLNSTDMGLRHFAVTRDGNNINLYENGTRIHQNTSSLSGPLFSGGNADLVLGANNNGTTDPFNGSLDSIRITSGTARYTGATYDVPSEGWAHN